MSNAEIGPLETPPTPAPVQRRGTWSGRSLTSLTLMLLFVVMAFSGIILYVTPRGRMANWSDWTLIGLSKSEWASLHVNSCILFLALTVIHLVINWSAILHYLKRKDASGPRLKKEIFVAAAVVVLISLGAIREWPPFSTVMSWNHAIKDLWENRSVQTATIRPGEQTLTDFAAASGAKVADVEQALVDAGYEVEATQTLFEIGQANGVRPRELLDVLGQRFPKTAAGKQCESGGGCERSGGGAKACPDKQSTKACPDKKSTTAAAEQADAEKPHDGPKGFGPGQGRGMGMGRGMGKGMGRGPGMGRGQGQGKGRGAHADDESE